MAEFQLDTSGAVADTRPLEGDNDACSDYRWSDLDAFTQGYIEAAFFTETCPDYTRAEWDTLEARTAREEGAVSGEIPSDFGFADLAPETLAAMIADCAAFLEPNRAAILEAETLAAAPGKCDHSHAGRDFWYTRNGHGCGFWDGDWPEPYASELTTAAKGFGEFNLYLGDDGKIHA